MGLVLTDFAVRHGSSSQPTDLKSGCLPICPPLRNFGTMRLLEHHQHGDLHTNSIMIRFTAIGVVERVISRHQRLRNLRLPHAFDDVRLLRGRIGGAAAVVALWAQALREAAPVAVECCGIHF